jgi:hypothetical protein
VLFDRQAFPYSKDRGGQIQRLVPTSWTPAVWKEFKAWNPHFWPHTYRSADLNVAIWQCWISVWPRMGKVDPNATFSSGSYRGSLSLRLSFAPKYPGTQGERGVEKHKRKDRMWENTRQCYRHADRRYKYPSVQHRSGDDLSATGAAPEQI